MHDGKTILQDSHQNENEKRLELAERATSGSGLLGRSIQYHCDVDRFGRLGGESYLMQMLHQSGLVDNVCRVVHNERSNVPKQCSTLAIMNLSNGDPDHVLEMARCSS